MCEETIWNDNLHNKISHNYFIREFARHSCFCPPSWEEYVLREFNTRLVAKRPIVVYVKPSLLPSNLLGFFIYAIKFNSLHFTEFYYIPFRLCPPVFEPDFHIMCGYGRVILPIGHWVQEVGVLWRWFLNLINLYTIIYLFNLKPARVRIFLKPTFQYWLKLKYNTNNPYKTQFVPIRSMDRT